eukprot:scaffold60817_cov30-Tisochrysis_lutea.AAC.2
MPTRKTRRSGCRQRACRRHRGHKIRSRASARWRELIPQLARARFTSSLASQRTRQAPTHPFNARRLRAIRMANAERIMLERAHTISLHELIVRRFARPSGCSCRKAALAFARPEDRARLHSRQLAQARERSR